MNNDEYAKACRRTDTDKYSAVLTRLHLPKTLMILHALMGITTECGELMDQLKKHLIYGKPLDDVNLFEEDGDLRWYLALLEFACGYTADAAQEANINKLKARYPEKFNEVDAMVRDLEKERKVLEGQ
jgi:hypothetical protein